MIKILLYNLSLFPLYIVFIIKTFNYDKLKCINEIKIIEILNLFYKPLIFLFLLVAGLLTLIYFIKSIKLGNELPKKIESFKRIDYEHLTFLATFILPVFAVDLKTTKDLIVLFFILFVMGLVYIKSDMYYLNPIFLIFGWYLYNIKRNNEEIIAISTFKLNKNSNFIEKKIDENFIFIQKV